MSYLSADELRLKVGVQKAVDAAGGLKNAAAATDKSTSQLSRCQSRDHTDSLSVRDAMLVDQHRMDQGQNPHILSAYARSLDCVVIRLASGVDDENHLIDSLTEMTIHLGHTAQAVHEAVHPGGEDGEVVTPREAQLALDRLHEHDLASAKLRQKLERLAKVGR